LIALIIVYILFFVAVTTIYFTQSQKNIAVKNLEERAVTLLKIMSISSSTQIFWSNFDKLNQYTQKVKENLDVKYVMIIDKNGSIIAHTDRWRIGLKVSLPGDFNVLESTGVLKKYIDAGKPAFTVSSPIIVIDQIVGYIILQYSLDSIEQKFRAISQNGFGLATILGIIGVILSLATAYRVTRPIDQVMEGMEKIRRDEYDVKINVDSGAREFQTLANAFNNMGAKLKFTIRKLDQERRRSEAIINSISDGLMIVDKNQRIGFFNKGAEKILGYTQEEALGMESFEVINSLEFKEINRQLLKQNNQKNSNSLSLDNSQNQQISLVNKDGRSLVILMSAAPVVDSQGEVYGAVEVFKEITSLLAMENKLKESDRLASIGVLAAGMAHEINNPITGIIGLSGGLLKKYTSDSLLAEDLTIIKEQGERCGTIIKNLMNLAMDAPKAVTPMEINTILHATVRILSKTSPDIKTKFIESYDAKNSVITGDESQIIQVFTNIIRNAISAMRSKGVLLISTKTVDSKLEIVFKDAGEGIAPVNINRVCDPFFTTKKLGEGMGLRLLMVST
jgi:PAS domain S-box-containing protein